MSKQHKPKTHAFTAADMAVAEDARKLLALAVEDMKDMSKAHAMAEAMAFQAKTEPDLNPDFLRTIANTARLNAIERARQAFAILRTISPRAKK